MAFPISEMIPFITSAPTCFFKHMIHAIDVQFVTMSLGVNEAFQATSSSMHVNSGARRHINIFNSHTNSFNRRISHSGAAFWILCLCTSGCIAPKLVMNQACHYHLLLFSLMFFKPIEKYITYAQNIHFFSALVYKFISLCRRVLENRLGTLGEIDESYTTHMNHVKHLHIHA